MTPTLVLLDTNAYLRLAKRIVPLLGVEFGQKRYVPTILKDVEDEVVRSPRLRSTFPWVDDPDRVRERRARRVRLLHAEKVAVHAVASVLREHVLDHAAEFTTLHRSPPSQVDCWCLAFGQVRPAIVVTDDLGMHRLAEAFEIAIWHGWELLKKLHTAKRIDNELVREIYAALEANRDLPATWVTARHSAFRKLFGSAPG